VSGIPVHFVHYPQPNELMAFNTAFAGAGSGENGSRYVNYFCGKTDQQNIYSCRLDAPMLIVQFKPHGWYAFARHGLASYSNAVSRLPCRLSEDLRYFAIAQLPEYLEKRLCKAKSREAGYRMMPEILRYIDEHLNTVNVISIGRVFNLSEATLRRYFKKYVGVNVSHYIRDQKVKSMTMRIYCDDYNAIAVQECGFYDQSHFIREFKRVHRVTPTQFMEQLNRVFRRNKNSEKLFNACYLEL
jgi:AraC-like DNA-binding protein